jgi:hypothetical protein
LYSRVRKRLYVWPTKPHNVLTQTQFAKNNRKLYAGRRQVRYPRGVARTLFDIPEGIGDIPEEGYDIPEGIHDTNNSRKNS